MKLLSKTLVTFLTSLFVLFSCKEKQRIERVPENIQNTFRETFPNAVNVKWEKNSDDTEWEADFVMSGSKHSVRYKSDGGWFETEYEIVISKIPEAIKAKVVSMYPEYKIIKAEVVLTDSGKEYELKLDNGQEFIGVFYTEDGTFIKQEKED